MASLPEFVMPRFYDAMAQQIAGQHQAQQSGIGQQLVAAQQLGLQHQQEAALRSPPSPPSEGPKVGDVYRGAHPFDKFGPITIVEAVTSGHYAGEWRGKPERMCLGIYTTAQLGDRLTPAASPERKATTSHIEAALAKAGKVTIAMPDPYANFPHGMNDAQVAVAMRMAETLGGPERAPNAHDRRVAAARLAREARYERRKAETVEAFERPLATVAVGGRFGRRVGLVNENWPSQDGSDEP